MEGCKDTVIILPRSDIERADKAIVAVRSELDVEPTKAVFFGDEVWICYRPWHEKVFREALEKLPNKTK